jgi:hypothetical protein
MRKTAQAETGFEDLFRRGHKCPLLQGLDMSNPFAIKVGRGDFEILRRPPEVSGNQL